jgi:hypothetical protein
MNIGTIQNGTVGVCTVGGVSAVAPLPFASDQAITVTTAGDLLVNLSGLGTLAEAVAGSALVALGVAKSGTTGVVTGSPLEFGSGVTNGLIAVGTLGDISITNASGYPITVASNGTCHCTTTIIPAGATVSVTATNATGNLTVTGSQGDTQLLNAGNNVVTAIGTGTLYVLAGALGLNNAFLHKGRNNNGAFLSGDDDPVRSLQYYNWGAVASYVNGGYSLGIPQSRVMGACTTSGVTVTAATGTVFNVLWPAGTVVKINGVPYEIASVTSASVLVLQGVGAGTQASAVQFICDNPPSGIFAGFKEILAIFINPVNGYTFQFNPVTNCIQAYATDGSEASGADLHQMVTPMLIIGI